MKPKVSSRQLIAIINLLTELKSYQAKGLGKILDIVTMVNFEFPNSVFLRYEKDYTSGGERTYEFRIAEIGRDGLVTFIDDKFKTVFERYSFLGESKPFNIEDPNDFEKID